MQELEAFTQQHCGTEEKAAHLHDGVSPLCVTLDTSGSFLWYLPSLTCDEDAARWFQVIQKHLFDTKKELPRPPKDTSNANDRAQFYARGTYLPDRSYFSSVTDVCNEELTEDVESKGWKHEMSKAYTLRLNPRWCSAAWPLEEPKLNCILHIKSLAEQAVRNLLASHEDFKEYCDSMPRLSDEPLFNSVLVNWYADGRSQIKWHSDDERCYGNPTNILIASVSLGASRYFELRRKPRRGDSGLEDQRRRGILLHGGSLLVMAGATQAEWQHCLPPDQTCNAPRINLTFRRIVGEKRRGEG